MSTAPVLDGIHHLKLPVTDLDRSLAWYQEHLGYGVMTEFVEEGVRMGVAMTHPNGGPDLALRCDPDRARAAAGFDYFSIGVPGHDPIEALAAHLTERGVHHDGVHRTPVGWVLLGVHDPDGHDGPLLHRSAGAARRGVPPGIRRREPCTPLMHGKHLRSRWSGIATPVEWWARSSRSGPRQPCAAGAANGGCRRSIECPELELAHLPRVEPATSSPRA